jgi:uncharacterized membrane protein
MQTSRHFVERWTQWALRIGVWSSASLMFLGLILNTLDPAGELPHLSLGEAFQKLASLSVDAPLLITMGLIFLMLTPYLRVLTAIIGFTAEKDWKFSIVSLTVFLMLVGELLYSLH